MKRTLAVGATLFVVLLAGCQVPPKGQDTTAKPTTAKSTAESAGPANVWERSRQCAERAETAMKRVVAAIRPEDPQRLLGWENHYSPKFERCYVHASFENRRGDSKLGIPVIYETLFDAFENRAIAGAETIVASDEAGHPFCNIDDGTTNMVGNCAQARAYIDERMSK